MKANTIQVLGLIALAMVPVLLLIFGLIPLYLRGALLILIAMLLVGLVFWQKMSTKELGLRTDNFTKALKAYFLFTLVGLIGLIILSSVLNKTPLEKWWTYSHLQWAFLPISFAQEFVYRAYLQTNFQKRLPAIAAILLTTILYSGMHILWRDPLIMVMTFIGGLGWGYLWYRYPNFYLISLSHTILNFTAIFLGFFPWLITDYF